MDPHDAVEKVDLTSVANTTHEDDQDNGTASLPPPAYTNSGDPVGPPPPTSEQVVSEKKQKRDPETYRNSIMKKFNDMRMECIQLSKLDGLDRFEQEYLDEYSRKCSAYAYRLSQIEPDKKEVNKIISSFQKWKENDGFLHQEALKRSKALQEEKRADEAKEIAKEEAYRQRMRDEADAKRTKKKVTFSKECDEVYADMKKQYKQYQRDRGNRGAWWKSPAPGITENAESIPTDVFNELIERLKGTSWRFEGSFSGGESFHKNCGGTDFIYHRHPPH